MQEREREGQTTRLIRDECAQHAIGVELGRTGRVRSQGLPLFERVLHVRQFSALQGDADAEFVDLCRLMITGGRKERA